jgi:hypothetical protein
MKPIYVAEFMVLEHGLMSLNTVKAYSPMYDGRLWRCDIDLPERGVVGREVFGITPAQALEQAAKVVRRMFEGKMLRGADGNPFQLPRTFAPDYCGGASEYAAACQHP